MRKAFMLVFIALTIVDLINCAFEWREVSMWLRSVQMVVLLLWVSQFNLSPILRLNLTAALILSVVIEFLFYSYGASLENIIIFLISSKNVAFIYILYKDIKKLRLTQKLIRWALTYIGIFITICFLIDGYNALIYIIGIESAVILLFISLKKSDAIMFRQKYLGYCIMILSLIFGKILIYDSRWFIEAIDRISFALGHLLFVAGLMNVKVMIGKSNTLDYQTVK